MARINSTEELAALRDSAKKALTPRAGEAKVTVRVSMSPSGIAVGARDTMRALLEELANLNFAEAQIVAVETLELDRFEPALIVRRNGTDTVYGRVTPDMARQIAQKDIVGGTAVKEWVIERDAK